MTSDWAPPVDVYVYLRVVVLLEDMVAAGLVTGRWVGLPALPSVALGPSRRSVACVSDRRRAAAADATPATRRGASAHAPDTLRLLKKARPASLL